MTIFWLPKTVVLGAHQKGIERFGGLPGIRDEGALESALVRPINKHSYGETDLAALAAAYAFGFAKNHPFNDGNKRTALSMVIAFLAINNHELVADKVALTEAFLKLAASDLPEEGFADFLRANITPIRP